MGVLQSLYFKHAASLLGVEGIANYRFGFALVAQTLRYASWLVLLPAMARFVHLYPLGRDLWESRRSVLWYVLSMPTWLGAHSVIMSLGEHLSGMEPRLSWHDHWLNVMASFLVQNAAIGVVLLLALAARDLQQRLREQEQAEERLRTEAASARLGATLSAAQPAVFFPSLQGLAALIPKDPARALELVDRLGEFLRLSLQRGTRSEVELGEEIDLLKRFFSLEEMRRGQLPRVSFLVPPEAHECRLPANLLLPLISQLLAAHPHGTPEFTVDPARPGLLVLRGRGQPDFSAIEVDGALFQVERRADGVVISIPLSPPLEDPLPAVPASPATPLPA